MQLAVGPGVSHWWSLLTTMQVREEEQEIKDFYRDWWEEAGGSCSPNKSPNSVN